MNKIIRVSSWLTIFLFVGTVICVVAFNLIGQEVDAQGILHEPFFLAPLSLFFLLLSIIAGGVNIFVRMLRARNKKMINQ
jgi:thiol:disulfide interchange protein